MRDFDAEIAELEKRATTLQAEKERVAKQPIEQRIAELLHTAQCHYNHTDGCGWEYESWDSKGGYGGGTRAGWLKKAHALVEKSGLSAQSVLKVLDAMGSLR